MMDISVTADAAQEMDAIAIWMTVFWLFLLTVASAFFAGSETALTGASRSKMHALAKGGDWRAKLVVKTRQDSENLIATILLVNTLLNILASALTTSLFITLFGMSGVLYATILMTAVILIFAEVMPKTIAINNADNMALLVVPVIYGFLLLLKPITAIVKWIVRRSLKAIGIKADNMLGHALSDEELRGAIDLHGHTDDDAKDRSHMLRSILDLAEIDVSEVMTHRKNVVMLDIEQKSSALIDEALSSNFTRVALYKDSPDNIVGILHAKQLLRAIRSHAEDLDQIDINSVAQAPWFIPETTSLLDQLQAFQERREHFAIVVDEYGSLMGVVTLEDIIEEIVGEVFDEYDVNVPGVRPQADGSYVVNGSVSIRELNREFDWRLPDEAAVTLAGLILHEARQIPDVGQVFHFYGLRFEILRRQRHQLTSLRVTPPAKTQSQGDIKAA
jgi:Mg2+/Co2+ transporter CorB